MNTNQRYMTMIFDQASLENKLWEWKENPLSCFGGDEWEKVIKLPDTFTFSPELVTEKEMETIIGLADGAYSLQVDKHFCHTVQIQSTRQYKDWYKCAYQEWLSLAKKKLGELPELTIQEFFHIASENGDMSHEPKETVLEAVSLFGMESLVQTVLTGIQDKKLSDWFEYLEADGEYQQQIDTTWDEYAQECKRIRLAKEAKAKQLAEAKVKEAKALADKTLPHGKFKPALKCKK